MTKVNITQDFNILYNHFLKRLPGQEQLVRSVLTSLKLRDICYNGEFFKNNEVMPPKMHLLVRGPSGSGKTFSINRICKDLGIPFLAVNITDFTSSGYVGASLTDIPKMLIDIAEQLIQENKFKKENQPVKPIEEKKSNEPELTGDELVRSKIKTTKQAVKYYEGLVNKAKELGCNLTNVVGKPRSLVAPPQFFKVSRNYLLNTLKCLNGDTKRVDKRMQSVITDIPICVVNKKEIIEIVDLISKPIRKSFSVDDFLNKFRDQFDLNFDKKAFKNSDPKDEVGKLLAQAKGVILLDEFDKIFMGNEKYNVGTTGVVREILAYLSGSNIPIKGKSIYNNDEVFNTNGVVFICAGAFDMVDHKTMPTEILGRLPTRVKLKQPDKDVFYKMLTIPEVGVWDMLKGVLIERGLKGKIVITDEVCDYFSDVLVADEVKKPIGVRRLTAIISILTSNAFLDTSLDLTKDFIVTKELIDTSSKIIRMSLEDF